VTSSGTTTPDYCTIASNSLCNSDCTSFGSNILIGAFLQNLNAISEIGKVKER
jgi:hypothetical protein